MSESKDNRSELLVIGAGFGRTGTATLKAALEQLGFGPCYHMLEVVERDESALWVKVMDPSIDRNATFDEIFKRYRSAVDLPASGFYKS